LTTGAAGKLDGGDASTGMESAGDVPLRTNTVGMNFQLPPYLPSAPAA